MTACIENKLGMINHLVRNRIVEKICMEHLLDKRSWTITNSSVTGVDLASSTKIISLLKCLSIRD